MTLPSFNFIEADFSITMQIKHQGSWSNPETRLLAYSLKCLSRHHRHGINFFYVFLLISNRNNYQDATPLKMICTCIVMQITHRGPLWNPGNRVLACDLRYLSPCHRNELTSFSIYLLTLNR